MVSTFCTSWQEAAAPLQLCPKKPPCFLATSGFIYGTRDGLYGNESQRGRDWVEQELARCGPLAQSAFWLCCSWLRFSAQVWGFVFVCLVGDGVFLCRPLFMWTLELLIEREECIHWHQNNKNVKDILVNSFCQKHKGKKVENIKAPCAKIWVSLDPSKPGWSHPPSRNCSQPEIPRWSPCRWVTVTRFLTYCWSPRWDFTPHKRNSISHHHILSSGDRRHICWIFKLWKVLG